MRKADFLCTVIVNVEGKEEVFSYTMVFVCVLSKKNNGQYTMTFKTYYSILSSPTLNLSTCPGYHFSSMSKIVIEAASVFLWDSK